MDTNLKGTVGLDAPKPSEAEVVQTLVDVEHASQATPKQGSALPPDDAPPQSWVSRNAPLLVFVTLAVLLVASVYWMAPRIGKQLRTSHPIQIIRSIGAPIRSSPDAALQAAAEGLLQRVAAGDSAAADEIISQSGNWVGKTRRTPRTDQFIAAGINAPDMRIRAASLQAQLAFDGIPLNDRGFAMLAQAAGNPRQRTWALWLLGAIGNRGVDPPHAAKVIDAYLSDPDVPARVSAVEGLALLGTDETIPMLLDRFRNDPAPPVQEQAACGMAEAGMYTHAQRMVAAASLVGWVDDSLLSQQQRGWAAQALHDISGQNFGSDSAAWRNWYEKSR
jgi:HEAT repeat protein